MSDKQNEMSPEFPINQSLLEEATHSREEWRVIKDRLAKIDQNKGQVTPAVYGRVHKDYEGRLEKAMTELLKKKDAIDHELITLKETRKKISTQLAEHRQKLEEIKFRNTLGEYGEEEYQNASRIEQDKVAKFETVLNAIDSNINRYDAVFKDETGLFATPKVHVEEEEPSESNVETSGISHKTRETEPLTDNSGFVIEEEGPDYFSATTDAEKTNPTMEESATEKKHPHLVIINGDDAGTSYSIDGEVSFGRAESNTIVLRNAKVSRQHAQIHEQGNECVIIDLNSSNGTYVNGQRIEEHVLSNGDEIQIGDFVLQFQS